MSETSSVPAILVSFFYDNVTYVSKRHTCWEYHWIMWSLHFFGDTGLLATLFFIISNYRHSLGFGLVTDRPVNADLICCPHEDTSQWWVAGVSTDGCSTSGNRLVTSHHLRTFQRSAIASQMSDGPSYILLVFSYSSVPPAVAQPFN